MTAWCYLTANNFDLPVTVAPAGLFVSTPGYTDTFQYYAKNHSINYDTTFHATSASSNVAQATSIDWSGRTWNISPYGDKLFLKTCVSPGPPRDANNNPVFPCYGPELARTVESSYVIPYPLFDTGFPFWETATNPVMISRTGGDKFAVKLFGKLLSCPSCPPEPPPSADC